MPVGTRSSWVWKWQCQQVIWQWKWDKCKEEFQEEIFRGKFDWSHYMSRRHCYQLYMQVANILPDPFPIPLFRKSTMDSLEQKKYTTDDRKYMIRVLSTMILTHVEKATMNDCAQVSKALTRRYPFLGDYVSVVHVGEANHIWNMYQLRNRCLRFNRFHTRISLALNVS